MIKQRARRISRWFLLFLVGCVGAAVVVGAVLAIGWAGIGALKVLHIVSSDYSSFCDGAQFGAGLFLLGYSAYLAAKGLFRWAMWAFELDEVAE